MSYPLDRRSIRYRMKESNLLQQGVNLMHSRYANPAWSRPRDSNPYRTASKADALSIGPERGAVACSRLGTPRRIRTSNTGIKSPLRYRCASEVWHTREDSNPDLTVLETVVLPLDHGYTWRPGIQPGSAADFHRDCSSTELPPTETSIGIEPICCGLQPPACTTLLARRGPGSENRTRIASLEDWYIYHSVIPGWWR